MEASDRNVIFEQLSQNENLLFRGVMFSFSFVFRYQNLLSVSHLNKIRKLHFHLKHYIIASGSQEFINKNKLVKDNFIWQSSASAFSVSKIDINKVCKYILNQPVHHRKITFAEEYDSFIKYYQQNLSRS